MQNKNELVFIKYC